MASFRISLMSSPLRQYSSIVSTVRSATHKVMLNTKPASTNMVLVCLLLLGSALAWTPVTSLPGQQMTMTRASNAAIVLNGWLDALTGGQNQQQLPPVPEIPYGQPLLPLSSSGISEGDETTIAIAERGISFTGEDFDIVTIPTNTALCRVRGALLHLPGKDCMRLFDKSGQECAKLDRKLVSLTPTYDIYRVADGKKIGWIEKVVVALRDTFEFHLEDAPKVGPFKSPAAFKLEGDFLDRKFVMKSDKGQTVAIVSKDGFFPQWNDNFNHYQVKIAPGMDVGLVVACACAIDEDLDEEHQKRDEERRKRQENGGGWFG